MAVFDCHVLIAGCCDQFLEATAIAARVIQCFRYGIDYLQWCTWGADFSQ